MSEWRLPFLAHGVDYYPEQWLDRPDVLAEDVRLMKAARVNIVTLGVFAWCVEEPREGEFDFAWLEERLDQLHAAGIRVLLATPSGARPAWLDAKYPEVLRVTEDRLRNLRGMRMNHCYTSPVYRALVRRVDTELARRFARHPAVVGWHISNEYHGECHCPLCQQAFRQWLQARYGTLDALNAAWWTTFWSKRYTAWEQIESPSSRGERALQGLRLDWLRFVTDQTKDFMRMEVEAVRPFHPELPVTTNMIGKLIEIDTPRFRDVLDVAALDVYPEWGGGDDERVADETALDHDLTRCLLDKPYLLLETTPSMTNWQAVGQAKRPGMHMLCAMQALAHGADAFMMFQWRKSRGGFEKFHGAVIGHDGRGDTRVFSEVAQVGERLERLAEIAGTRTRAEAALLFDWNNRWAIRGSKGPREGIDPEAEALAHYQAMARQGVDIDVIDTHHDFSGYRLIAAPMLYLIKPGVAERLAAFVRGGGTLLTTYYSGVADQNDLCFDTGAPGPLRELLGVRSEELDSLYPGQTNALLPVDGGPAMPCGFFCDVIHAETAEVRAVYASDFYAGRPGLTVHRVGAGRAWYLAARVDEPSLNALYARLVRESGVKRLLPELPCGVRAHSRIAEDGTVYLFCLNFNAAEVELCVPDGVCVDTGERKSGRIKLAPLEGLALRIDEREKKYDKDSI